MNGPDLIDKVFGRWVVVNKAHVTEWHERTWYCLCECGNYAYVRTRCLIKGRSRSCGCLRADNMRKI